MGLSVGIVGLPNAGKSTLFNALASKRVAQTAIHPFTTIDPHEAVVSVPDLNLAALSVMIKPDKTVPAAVTFIDIAGLVKDAHKGEGLGNQFLGKIREVDAVVHVVRAFKNESVSHPYKRDLGTLEQILDDIDIVNFELELGNIRGKKVIYVLNAGEYDINSSKLAYIIDKVKKQYSGEAVILSALLEEELIDFSPEEKETYLNQSSVTKTGLEILIQKAYKLLNLITFYTIKGGVEVHAWSLREGSTAFDAAAKVHTDFAKNFIKAEVIEVKDLLLIGGWKKAKEIGKVRLEGKDYQVKDKDVIEFKFGK